MFYECRGIKAWNFSLNNSMLGVYMLFPRYLMNSELNVFIRPEMNPNGSRSAAGVRIISVSAFWSRFNPLPVNSKFSGSFGQNGHSNRWKVGEARVSNRISLRKLRVVNTNSAICTNQSLSTFLSGNHWEFLLH